MSLAPKIDRHDENIPNNHSLRRLVIVIASNSKLALHQVLFFEGHVV